MSKELKELHNLPNLIPGNTIKERLRYLIENYPPISVKDLAELLGAKSTAAVHSAKYAIKKEGVIPYGEQSEDPLKEALQAAAEPEEVHELVKEDPFKQRQQLDDVFGLLSVTVRENEPPVRMELNLDGAAPLVVRTMLETCSSTLKDNKTYKLSIKLESE